MDSDQEADSLARTAERLTAEFFEELALLHIRAGEPPLRAVAKLGNRLSASNLSELLSGRRTAPPGYDVLTEVVKALMHGRPEPEVRLELEAWRERWVQVRTAQRAADKAATEQKRRATVTTDETIAAARAKANDIISAAETRAQAILDQAREEEAAILAAAEQMASQHVQRAANQAEEMLSTAQMEAEKTLSLAQVQAAGLLARTRAKAEEEKEEAANLAVTELLAKLAERTIELQQVQNELAESRAELTKARAGTKAEHELPPANLAVTELLAKLGERTNELQQVQAELAETRAELMEARSSVPAGPGRRGASTVPPALWQKEQVP